MRKSLFFRSFLLSIFTYPAEMRVIAPKSKKKIHNRDQPTGNSCIRLTGKVCDSNIQKWDFPGGPGLRLHELNGWVWAQSMVGELRSHILHSAATPPKNFPKK